MRLCMMLVENNSTNQPQVNALLSLMCFHASRFEARTDENGEAVLYEDQDELLWNAELISRGGYYLHCAANGNQVSKYHLEAAIAYWNTRKTDSPEKWQNILDLYDQLLQTAYSPMAALHRIYALSKTGGKREAIAAAEKLKMNDNLLYFLLLGELYHGIDTEKARVNLQKSLELAKTASGKQTIMKKLSTL